MNNDEFLDDVAAEWGVGRVLAAISELDATAPSDDVRAAVLHRAAASPRQLTVLIAPSELYARRVGAMHALLEQLTGSDWSKPARPYSWSVHGLVAHLLVIEQYTAVQLGLETSALPLGDHDHLAIGADAIEAELRGSPAATVARWVAAAHRNVAFAQSEDFHPLESVVMHGWPFSASAALVARAFEVWTHTDDIRRATGREPEAIAAEELRTMSSFSVASLAFLLPTVASDMSLSPTRVVLTGAGGGTYDIGGDGERAALVVADVVEYCRVVARRLEPHDLAATVEGDRELVSALLEASRAFAV